jgi:hypothetical protein
MPGLTQAAWWQADRQTSLLLQHRRPELATAGVDVDSPAHAHRRRHAVTFQDFDELVIQLWDTEMCKKRKFSRLKPNLIHSSFFFRHFAFRMRRL